MDDNENFYDVDEAQSTWSNDGKHLKEEQNKDWSLHKACFNNEVEEIEKILKRQDKSLWTNFDPQGNTAMHVAILKGHKEAVQKLLEYDFPYNFKNKDRWKPIMFAVAQKDEEIVKIILQYKIEYLKSYRDNQKKILVEALSSLEDCQFKISWEFGSFLLWPILKQYAPSDTYQVWKRGSDFRIDGTMMGIDQKSASVIPKWKKGHFSILLNIKDASEPRIMFLDHKKKRYWDITTEVRDKMNQDKQEGNGPGSADDLQVQIMISNGARKNYLKSDSFQFSPAKGWITNKKHERVDGWKTVVYNLEGQLVTVKKVKQRVHIPKDASFDDYIDLELTPDYVKEIKIDPFKGLPGKGGTPDATEAEMLAMQEEMLPQEDLYQDVVAEDSDHSSSQPDPSERSATNDKLFPSLRKQRSSINYNYTRNNNSIGESIINNKNNDNNGKNNSNDNNNVGNNDIDNSNKDKNTSNNDNNSDKNNGNGVGNNNQISNTRILKHSATTSDVDSIRSESLRKGNSKVDRKKDSIAENNAKNDSNAEKDPKKVSCKCWMAQDFPMQLTQLLPLLQVVSHTNKYIGKAARFMENYGQQNMFPVKVQVPLMFTVYIILSTRHFELLNAKSKKKLNAEFFSIPKDYTVRTVEESLNNMAQNMAKVQEKQQQQITEDDKKAMGNKPLEEVDDKELQKAIEAIKGSQELEESKNKEVV